MATSDEIAARLAERQAVRAAKTLNREAKLKVLSEAWHEEQLHRAAVQPIIPITPSLVVGQPTAPPALADTSHFDNSNPRSLINLLPKFIAEYAVLVPSKYFEMREEELAPVCFESGQPFDEARKLRISFWDEYDRCQRYDEKKMLVTRITDGICAEPYFIRKFITKQKHLAWILRPPTGYIAALQDIHDLSLRQMLAIVQLPLQKDDRGNWDTKLMNLQKAIYERTDARLKGAIAEVHQIDQRNLQVNVNATGKEAKEMLGPNSAPTPLTFEEVESRIRQLEKKSVLLQAPSHIEPDLMRDISPSVPENVPVEIDEEAETITNQGD